MSRKVTILRNILAGVVALAIVAVVAAILVVQTAWFGDYVKDEIISSTELSTGGKVEVGSFSFDWKHLRAVVTNFVIHGDEPAPSAPFLRARRVQVDIRLLTSLHHLWDIAYLGIESPEANIVVFPDDRTNIPRPKQKSTGTRPLVTVVDLAIGHFDLKDGRVNFASESEHLNMSGRNLRAEFWFNTLKQGYQGQLAFQPIYVVSGHNAPVRFSVALPVAIQDDHIDFHQAKISTSHTSLMIDGSIENLRSPKVSAHVAGTIALSDLKSAANVPIEARGNGLPAAADLDADVMLANDAIQVKGLRLTLGNSIIEAHGTLKDPRGIGSLEFKSRLALGELGKLSKLPARPDGTLAVDGVAKLDANNDYQVQGNLSAKGVSFQQDGQRIPNLDLVSAIRLDPHKLDLHGLHLAVFGGEFTGDASLQDFEHYKIQGNLRSLSLRTAVRVLGEKQFAYDGAVSGPIDVAGDLKSEPVTKALTAHVRLAVAPGHQGIPLSGRMTADYDGSADRLSVTNSYLSLPHSRVTLNGSLPRQLNLALTTSDANDLLALTSMEGKSPVSLNDRQASFNAIITGRVTAPQVAGHLAANGFSVEGRLFDSVAADLAASSRTASVQNGNLRRGNMDTQFAAHVGLLNWKATANQPLTADATVNNGDVADILALAGQPSTDYSGALSASLRLGGTIGAPRGSVNLQAQNGTIHGEAFDRLQAQVNLSDQLIAIPAAVVEAGMARVNLTAEYQHSSDSLTNGRLHAHVQSNQVELAQLRNLEKHHPNSGGTVQLDADVVGNVSEINKDGRQQTEFLLAGVNGSASARALQFEGENYGAFNAAARTSGQTVNYNVTSNFAGSNVHVTGNTQLVRDYPTSADANIQNLALERVLAVAKRGDIPARGNLSATVHFSGTIDHPQGEASLELSNAVLYDEPVDHARVRATYLPRSIDVPQLEVVAGPSRIDFTAHYDHPEHDFESGSLQFRVSNGHIDLARIKNVQNLRPGLSGTIRLAANGAADIRTAEPRILLRDLTGNLSASRVTAKGKNLGDLTLTANTSAGRLNFVLDSDLAGSSIHGRGNAELADSYPIDASLNFSNLAWSRLQNLTGHAIEQPLSFDLLGDGQVSVRGPALKYEEMRGGLEFARLQVTTAPTSNDGAKPVTLQNQGPIRATLDRQTVHIESTHLTGPQTDIQAGGTISLQRQILDLVVNANANLSLLRNFDRDITSSGTVTLGASIRGSFKKPLINGQLELKNASLNYASIPNGISNVNGVVMFSGNSASIRNMTAESGGGKITAAGFIAFRDELRFGLRADASAVRVRPQAGVSVVADANVRLTGTRNNSVLSGTATIDRLSYAPDADMGSLIATAAPPVQSANPPSPIEDNMKLDIRVRTSDATMVQSSLAENLQTQADLRIRGTLSRPAVLGQISITEGRLVFFGTTYTVNSGTIGFYNPVRIEPILDVNLEARAKGVNVTVRVSGPIDNMKLSYSSDPPLQFEEIVGLLAAGQTPTSDPTLLANQPSVPAQSFQQMGESALVGKTLADPLANRLQRVFGVNQLKIDPAFTNGSQLPQAQLTLQQQVANNVTFTYVTALDNANTQSVSVEFSLNPQWSAVAARDQNGIFSINFLYKRQLR